MSKPARPTIAGDNRFAVHTNQPQGSQLNNSALGLRSPQSHLCGRSAWFRKEAPQLTVGFSFNASFLTSSLSSDTYTTLKTERSHAAVKYDAIAPDADDLKKRIAELKRDTSQEAENARSSLERKLDDESRALKDLELTIIDLDNAMR